MVGSLVGLAGCLPSFLDLRSCGWFGSLVGWLIGWLVSSLYRLIDNIASLLFLCWCNGCCVVMGGAIRLLINSARYWESGHRKEGLFYRCRVGCCVVVGSANLCLTTRLGNGRVDIGGKACCIAGWWTGHQACHQPPAQPPATSPATNHQPPTTSDQPQATNPATSRATSHQPSHQEFRGKACCIAAPTTIQSKSVINNNNQATNQLAMERGNPSACRWQIPLASRWLAAPKQLRCQ